MMKGFAVEETLDVDLSSNPSKKKRHFPDPDVEVIALSPKSLLATNKFVCEVCGKGFQREQNLQLHGRGHNLPWKLKQRQKNEVMRRKVYICPEPSCSNHDPSRALGDLTGIKKHFFRKHGEKRWSCDKCSKKYAVLSDWKAHSKICGSKEYRCDCGTIFSRKDSFITHKAFCEVLATENYTRTMSTNPFLNSQNQLHLPHPIAFHNSDINSSFSSGLRSEIPQWLSSTPTSLSHQINHLNHSIYSSNICQYLKPSPLPSPSFSATALLQKAAELSSTISGPSLSELPTLFSSHDQDMMMSNNSLFSPLQFQSFPSCSGFIAPFEEAMGGLLMNQTKKEEGRRGEGDQARRDGTTRDFLGLRVSSSHEELFSISEI